MSQSITGTAGAGEEQDVVIADLTGAQKEITFGSQPTRGLASTLDPFALKNAAPRSQPACA